MDILIVSSKEDANFIIHQTFDVMHVEAEIDVLDEENVKHFIFDKTYDLVVVNDKCFIKYGYQDKAFVFSHLLKNEIPTMVFLEDRDRVDVFCGLNLLDYFYHPLDWQRVQLRLKVVDSKPTYKEFVKEKNVSDKFVVKSKNEVNLVNYDNILFFEKDGKKLYVHLEEETLVVQESIKLLMTRVPQNFIRVHNSYVVNTNHISKIKEVGNRSYEIMFNSFDKVALMSRYRSDALLKDFYRSSKKKETVGEMSV